MVGSFDVVGRYISRWLVVHGIPYWDELVESRPKSGSHVSWRHFDAGSLTLWRVVTPVFRRPDN